MTSDPGGLDLQGKMNHHGHKIHTFEVLHFTPSQPSFLEFLSLRAHEHGAFWCLIFWCLNVCVLTLRRATTAIFKTHIVRKQLTHNETLTLNWNRRMKALPSFHSADCEIFFPNLWSFESQSGSTYPEKAKGSKEEKHQKELGWVRDNLEMEIKWDTQEQGC